ncbi:uncharacterized protein LOC129319937 isoform X2 [Prosopis cineraria]|uniref:uncharacterized protein LOC129319937 isoform X2 n=1 Tax=Prosopis cineraria TaxID=364024 RepID=UPI002410AA35|nr:uncharacterized protein LOC129319937 isoform X2 [Prosopis cineraria]
MRKAHNEHLTSTKVKRNSSKITPCLLKQYISHTHTRLSDREGRFKRGALSLAFSSPRTAPHNQITDSSFLHGNHQTISEISNHDSCKGKESQGQCLDHQKVAFPLLESS